MKQITICPKCGSVSVENSLNTYCHLCSDYNNKIKRININFSTDEYITKVYPNGLTGEINKSQKKIMDNKVMEQYLLSNTVGKEQEIAPSSVQINKSAKISSKIKWFIIILIILFVIYLIGVFGKRNDGRCDYCSKQAEHRLGDEEFCDDHYIDRMGDIIEWSSEKNK